MSHFSRQFLCRMTAAFLSFSCNDLSPSRFRLAVRAVPAAADMAPTTSTESTTMSPPPAPKHAMSSRIFDAHLHVWSAEEPYPNGPPPAAVRGVGSTQQYVEAASNAKVAKALLVQPANYGPDHTYLEQAVRSHHVEDFHSNILPTGKAVVQTRLLGMYLATVKGKTVAEAVSELEEKARNGLYKGVRFNPALFPLNSEYADALYSAAGENGLAVGVMAFTGVKQHAAALRVLLKKYPNTKLIIDHFGFFRQPATGGIFDAGETPLREARDGKQGETSEDPASLPEWAQALLAFERGSTDEWKVEQSSFFSSSASGTPLPKRLVASQPTAEAQQGAGNELKNIVQRALSPKNDEECFGEVLKLASEHEQVYVKLSAWFRVSKEPFPHFDLLARVWALLRATGTSSRLLWGSDFPYVLAGGHDTTEAAVEYDRAVTVFDEWRQSPQVQYAQLRDEDVEWIMARTAEKLFGYHLRDGGQRNVQEEGNGAWTPKDEL